MRFSAVLALIAAATVAAADTNAARFARGLPPMSIKRASPIEGARRSLPSKIPGKPPGKPPVGGECDTGTLRCCEETSYCGDGGKADELIGLLNLDVAIGELIGTGCSGVVSSAECKQEPVCCNGNHFNGLVDVGCSPLSPF